MFAKKEKIHFIGIGGIGMSALAKILHAMEFIVSGSDIAENDSVEKLRSKGITVYIGHDAKNITDDISAVVTSTAIQSANPELLEAKARKITVIHRGELLAELMRLKYGIAIAGTHGKTTTTSIVSHLMTEAGLKPTCVIGGNHFNLGSNGLFGESDYLVCEADESDGSFLELSPVITIITNIDNDHMDYYGDMEKLRIAFLKFINKVAFYGYSFICYENEDLRTIARSIRKKHYSYGFSPSCDLYADNIQIDENGTDFRATFLGERIGTFSTKLIGEHNVLNSLASIGVLIKLNVDIETIKKALSTFKGVGRRLNIIYKDENIIIYDDYAHHPTEIDTTLSALRKAYKDRRIISVFQPHRYSRTEALFMEFVNAFSKSDIVIITDIYAASEMPRAGITSEIIINEMKKKTENIYYVPDKKDVSSFIKKIAKAKDIIITLGAGDIKNICTDIKNVLKPT